MKQMTTAIAAALFLLILAATAQAASISITANVGSDGALEITANGTDYASCDGNPNGGIAELYIEDTLYCAQYAQGNSSCKTVFDKATLSGSHTFTATATDCKGTATTTYTIVLDNTPTATPTAPSATEQAISVSINVDVRTDGGVAVTATGSGYTNCYPNPPGGTVRLYIWPALYCAAHEEGGSSSCTTVFDRATLNGTTTFTATATDCTGQASTTYTLVLDNTPSITPTGPASPVSGPFNFTADAVFKPTLNPTKGYIYLYVDGYHVGGVDKVCTTETCSYNYQEIAGHLYELPHGNHTFSFLANGGGVPHMSDIQTLTVDNTPTMTIATPTGTVSGTFNITGTATFKPSLNTTKGTITFYMDNLHIAAADKVCTTEECPYNYQDIRGTLYELPHGDHTVKLVANGNGKSTTTQQVFSVDNTPTVAISLPTGTVSSPTNILADATFKPSLNATKGTITFYMDNLHIAAGDKVCTTESCHYDYQQQLGHPYTLANGNHTVKLVANGNGKSSTDQKNFTVEACNLAISGFAASPAIINANGGQITNLQGTITGNNGRPINWSLSIEGGETYNSTGATVSIPWAGKEANGRILDTGSHTATLTAQTITNCSKTAQTTAGITAQSRQVAKQENPCGEESASTDITVGSTANTGSGNLNHSQSLFTVPNSKLMKSFELSYNSLDGQTAPLGTGWTHTYNITVTANNNATYTVTEGNGSKTAYYASGGHYTPQNSLFPKLTVNGDNTYTLEHKDGITYSFNQSGKITALSDRNGNAVTFAYTSGNLTGITDPSGRAISLSYGSANKISSVTDSSGNTHSFTYTGDTLTTVSSQIAYLGTREWSYAYDGSGFMLSKTDPESFTTAYTYDSNHRVTGATDPEDRTRSVSYTTAGQQTQLTEKDGGIWIFNYNPSIGALTQKTDPLGHSVSYDYDANGNLTEITDQRGNATTYIYDSAGNVTSVTDTLNQTTTYVYNSLNKPTSTTDPGNGVTSMTYDSNGNLTSVTDPLSNTTTYGYDSAGNLTSVTDAQNHVTTLAYNSNGYLESITEPTGAVTTFDYDSSGNLVAVTDALNHMTSYTYNGLNQVKSITDPENHLTTITYDLNGNVASVTDGNGNVTTYGHNYNGQVTSTTDANDDTTTFVYGGTGCPSCGTGVDKLTSLTDAKGNISTFTYDSAGRLTQQTNPTGSYRTYAYDYAGNAVSMTDENGNTTTYTYDALNRPTAVAYPGGGTKTFGYDSRGRLTTTGNANTSYTIAYDAMGRPLSITDTNGKVTAYQYDSLGRRTQLTTPDNQVMTYSYDNGNRLTQIQAGTDTFSLTNDLLGRRTTLSFPNSVSTGYSYSTSGNLTGIDITDSQQTVINSFLYGYDNTRNRTSLTDAVGTHTYSYDQTYQLLEALHPSPQTDEQYSYDQVGNRTGTTVNANNSLMEDAFFTYTYDLNGNLTSKTEKATNIVTTYTYDYENRLTRVQYPGMDAQYKYDPFGRRIEKNVNGTITQYVYDGHNIISQYDGSGAVTAAYIQNLSIDDPLSVTLSGAMYCLHKDSLRTVTDITDSAGTVAQSYQYDAFGNIIGTTGSITQPFTFTGREYDPETGLYYYRERYYDAKIGRFLNQDPIGIKGGINKYAYVFNSPTNWTDPLGLQATIIETPYGPIPIFLPPNSQLNQLTPEQWAEMREDLTRLFNPLPFFTTVQKKASEFCTFMSRKGMGDKYGPLRYAPGMPGWQQPTGDPNRDKDYWKKPSNWDTMTNLQKAIWWITKIGAALVSNSGVGS